MLGRMAVPKAQLQRCLSPLPKQTGLLFAASELEKGNGDGVPDESAARAVVMVVELKVVRCWSLK